MDFPLLNPCELPAEREVVGTVGAERASNFTVDTLNIQETNIFGVSGDETAPGFDVFTHQDREQLIG